jgi:serine/threonine-protein kinase
VLQTNRSVRWNCAIRFFRAPNARAHFCGFCLRISSEPIPGTTLAEGDASENVVTVSVESQRAYALCELVAWGDDAPFDETRRLTPAPSAFTISTRGAELPRVSLAPVEATELSAADFVTGRVLGEGGMGVVRLCHQRSLGRDVAVKTVRAGESDDAAALALVAEARVTGSLEHPGIVPVHTLGVDDQGKPVLVMKRVAGVVWRELLRDPGHPVWEKVRGDRLSFHLDVLRKVCDTVHFAHSQGVVHRDLKTGNVMVGDFGEVYVLDWGLACQVGTREAEARHVLGTPGFMAPEMLPTDDRPVTTRTDVYLLGAILHEMLTGRTRHEGDTLLQVLYSVWCSEPVDYPEWVPSELAALCNRAMQRDPDARVPDARAFADALVTFQEHRASERLTDAARARFSALRAVAPDAPRSTVQQLWTETRFGFRQAIEAWPENPRALAGQRDATAWMVRRELTSRDPDAAAALLATLDPPPPALVAEVAALRERIATEAREVERLRKLARERDTGVAAWERAHAASAAVGVSAGVPLALMALRGYGVAATHATLGLALGVVLALSAAFVWWQRGVFLANRAGRELIAMPFVALGGALVSLAFGAWAGLSVGVSAVMGLFVVTVALASMGVTLDRRLFAVSATTLVAAALSALYPAHVLDVVAAAGLCASLQVAVLFRTIAREQGARRVRAYCAPRG